MQKVTVSASRSYDILIGAGLLQQIGLETRKISAAKNVCIVSESTVNPLYGDVIEQSLQQAGFTVYHYVFPAGEASKNGEVYLQLLDFLARNKLTRSDILVALGGGVVGDLTGFAAATYLRGIQFIQVPTTLLAAVDSSVGGKTAIDLPAGKNLAGAFCQPSLVVCDTNTLNSLPEDIFVDGCAVVIKYSVIYDAEFFDYLFSAGPQFDREKVIRRCVELKRDVVMEDEFDTGARMKLNLGHTIGHGVEAGSHFTLSHGKSVAIGMAIVCRAASKRYLLSQGDADRVLQILSRFGLPVKTELSADTLFRYTLSDKKRSGDTVKLIIPTRIGSCDIVPTNVSALPDFIAAGV